MNPYSPIPRFVTGADHQHLISRILRPSTPADTQRIDLVTTSFMRVSIVDTGESPSELTAEGDTIIHVLWQKDENDGAIWFDEDRHPIAPGDTAMIPGGDRYKLSASALVVLVSVRKHSLALPVPPTHGYYHFDGYNRESRYPTDAGFSLSRWKITDKLTFAQTDGECIFISLYADLAIQHQRGITMLHQGEASVIRPEVGPITLVPNGLSYVLVID